MNPRRAPAFAILSLATMSLALAACARDADPASTATGDAETVVSRDEIVVRTHIAPESPTVADTIALTLTVESPPDAAVTWPDVAGALPDDIELLRERTVETSIAADGALSRTRRYELAPLLAGERTIPSLPFLFDEELILETPPLTVAVRSLLGDIETLAPRKDVAAPPPDYRQWALIGGAAIVGAALLALVAFLIVRRIAHADAAAQRRPAHEIALERIDALLAGDLLERRRFELFLSELADILRHYIEDRFAIHAPAQTTEEFLRTARRARAIDNERSAELGRFLQRCDLVKFARADATRDDADRAVDTVRQFIKHSAAPHADESSEPSHAAEPAP